jgi:hypothetical protein
MTGYSPLISRWQRQQSEVWFARISDTLKGLKDNQGLPEELSKVLGKLYAAVEPLRERFQTDNGRGRPADWYNKSLTGQRFGWQQQ